MYCVAQRLLKCKVSVGMFLNLGSSELKFMLINVLNLDILTVINNTPEEHGCNCNKSYSLDQVNYFEL